MRWWRGGVPWWFGGDGAGADEGARWRGGAGCEVLWSGGCEGVYGRVRGPFSAASSRSLDTRRCRCGFEVVLWLSAGDVGLTAEQESHSGLRSEW